MKNVYVLICISFLFINKITAEIAKSWITIETTGKSWGTEIASDGEGNIYIGGGYEGDISMNARQVGQSEQENFYIAKYSSAGDLIWNKTIKNNGLTKLASLVVDQNGNVYVALNFLGDLTWDNLNYTTKGNYDGLLVKLDKTGTVKWSELVGGLEEDQISKIAIDDNGYLYVTGISNSKVLINKSGKDIISSNGVGQAFVAKYGQNGSCLWIKNFLANKRINVADIAVGNDESIFIAGNFSGDVMFNDKKVLSTVGKDNIFLVKLNPSGEIGWVNHDGSISDDKAVCLATDRAGNIIMAGRFQLSAKFGEEILTSVKNYDVFVAKYNGQGKNMWARQISGGVGDETVKDLKVDREGNIYVLGDYPGGITLESVSLSYPGDGNSGNCYIACYDPDGLVKWAESIGGQGDNDRAHAMCITPSNQIWIALNLDGLTDLGEVSSDFSQYNTTVIKFKREEK